MYYNYIYDGSFDGLLTTLYYAFKTDKKPNSIGHKDNVPNFLEENIYVTTEEIKSCKVYDGIKKTLSTEILRTVFYSFLSEDIDNGMIIYRFLKEAFKAGPSIIDHQSNPVVSDILALRLSVSREVHYLLGLVRFKELINDIYYAQIKPSYNTIGLIAPHFSQRLNDQYWIIHDVGRGLGVFFNKNEWIIKNIDQDMKIEFSDQEKKYQELWKTYFNHIAIENRINPKLQRQNMPKKYWDFLIEMNP